MICLILIGVLLLDSTNYGGSYLISRVDSTINNFFAIQAKKGKDPVYTKKLSENVEKYLQLRELMKLKQGVTAGDELQKNVTSSEVFRRGGYQRFLGKGSLDQRLRAVIAYKRSSGSVETVVSDSDKNFGLSPDEEAELMEMMEEDEDDILSDGTSDELDEDTYYESLVLNAIENNKLSSMQKNMMIERSTMDQDTNTTTTGFNATDNPMVNTTSEEVKPSNAIMEDDDLYTPARTSWGLFQRPRNMSKAYGGGKVINVTALQMEFDKEKKVKDIRYLLSDTMKAEAENEVKIKDALSRCRGYMYVGERFKAVAVLESVQDFLSWQSDLGGEVLLELAMALETVDRVDEARKIYAKLASTCWNQKIRRQAVSLISGLDILKQIRKDVTPIKPFMDPAEMQSISDALSKGLRNEWNDYKKDRKVDAVNPWYDDENKILDRLERVETLMEAYNLLSRELNPLKKISSTLLQQAFRKLQQANESTLIEFTKNNILKSRMLQIGKGEAMDPILYKYRPVQSNSDFRYDFIDPNRFDLNNVINGTWDLVTSCLGEDKRGVTEVKRFEMGQLRRYYDVVRNSCSESFPVLWGLNTATIIHQVDWKPDAKSLILSSTRLPESPAPWIKRGKSEQKLRVAYCDEVLMVCRQTNEGRDLYTLWKKAKLTKWKKY